MHTEHVAPSPGAEFPILAAATALAAGALFAALARRVSARTPFPVDLEARDAVLDGPAPVHEAATAVSLLGYPVSFLPAAWLLAGLVRGKRVGLARRAIVGSAVGAWAGYHAVKTIVPRDRPPSQADQGNAERSFPSGHVTGVATVGLTASWVLAREGVLDGRGGLPAALGATALATVLMAAGRVGSDAHWLSDTAGGALLALATATAGALWYERARGEEVGA